MNYNNKIDLEALTPERRTQLDPAVLNMLSRLATDWRPKHTSHLNRCHQFHLAPGVFGFSKSNQSRCKTRQPSRA